MTYVFEQMYQWGENWNGELTNIPDNTIIKQISEYEWYVVIPNDNEEYGHYLGKGCAQVMSHKVFGWLFIHLNNIVCDWEEKNLELLEPFFKDKYALKLSRELYKYKESEIDKAIKENNVDVLFEKVQDEYLIECFKLIGLSSDSSFNTVRVYTRGNYSLIDNFDLKMLYIDYCDEDDVDIATLFEKDYEYVLTENSKEYNDFLKKALDKLCV